MNNEQLSAEEKQKYFDAFIEEYKENSLVDKQKIVISEFKELIGLLQKICSMNGKNPELITNREIIDVNKEGYTQEDFAEAVYTYMQMFKEILAEYILSIDNDNSEN